LNKLLLFLGAVFVAVLSFLPAKDFPTIPIIGIDKAVHFVLYATLGFLAALSFSSCPVRWRRYRFRILLILILYGSGIEFLQDYFYTLHRGFSFGDILFNSLGALTGLFIRFGTKPRPCRCREVIDQKILPDPGTEDSESESPALISHNPSLSKILAETFGWKPVIIRQDTLIIGALCTGRKLISLPHCPYGNVHNFCQTSENPLHATIATFLESSHYTSVEVRMIADSPSRDDTPKVASFLDIRHDPFLHFSSDLHQKILKSKKNGFTVEIGGIELLDSFYSIYSHHRRSIGSLPLPRGWFRNLLKDYNNGFCGIYLLKNREVLVGASFNLEFKGFYETCWMAVPEPWHRNGGIYAMVSEMIRHARTLHCQIFSFGSSNRDSEDHCFKRQWNTTDQPLIQLKVSKNPKENDKDPWMMFLLKYLPSPLNQLVENYLSKRIY